MNSDIKIGIVGLDTSHVVGICGVFNDSSSENHIPGARIVKAFPGGSRKFSMSIGRVEGFTAEVRDKFGVEIVNAISDMDDMDAFLLHSVDGDQHLEQFAELARFGKPVFIDKPLACCYQDAREIVKLAASSATPLMASSCIRYGKGIAGLVPEGESLCTVEAFGPMALLDDYRDYFWYGIHSAETLYSIFGRGFVSVEARSFENCDLLIGRRAGGRLGTICGFRSGSYAFGVRAVTNKGVHVGIYDNSVPALVLMARETLKFFQTGVPAVDPEENLEAIAFLEAASRSRAEGGREVKFSEFI